MGLQQGDGKHVILEYCPHVLVSEDLEYGEEGRASGPDHEC